MKPLRIVFASFAALIAVGFSATLGVADASPNWHVYNLAPSGRALTSPEATGQGADLATFDFLSTPTTSYLMTHQGPSGLLGDIRGRTVSATFSIDDSAGASLFGNPDGDACGTLATVRLFFQTSNAGGFDETHFWWSHPGSTSFAAGSGQVITSSVDGADWSDFFGHFGNDPAFASGFDAAAANATYIGLSFGSGCFFANGVGVQNGTATFHLVDFSVT
ncbi:MAG TPA: hypothetical protein VGA41_10060 [Candidatus Dormibacteraeota bacterium]